MANGNGTAKLIERILLEAKDEAKATMQQSDAACAAIRNEGEKRLQKQKADAEAAEQLAVDGILERSRTNAELEARKAALEERRKVIDEAFAAAYTALCALSDKERAQVCRRMLLTEAEGGETVKAAKADQKQLMQLLPAIEKEMIQAGKKPLVPSEETADVEYGFVLAGDGYEKDCSFAALLRELRAEEETKAAKLLFE